MTDDRKLNRAKVAISAIEDTENYGALMIWYEEGTVKAFINANTNKILKTIADLILDTAPQDDLMSLKTADVILQFSRTRGNETIKKEL